MGEGVTAQVQGPNGRIRGGREKYIRPEEGPQLENGCEALCELLKSHGFWSCQPRGLKLTKIMNHTNLLEIHIDNDSIDKNKSLYLIWLRKCIGNIEQGRFSGPRKQNNLKNILKKKNFLPKSP